MVAGGSVRQTSERRTSTRLAERASERASEAVVCVYNRFSKCGARVSPHAEEKEGEGERRRGGERGGKSERVSGFTRRASRKLGVRVTTNTARLLSKNERLKNNCKSRQEATLLFC